MHQPINTKNLREINRIVVAVILLSSDGKILLGKKDRNRGGVYADAWHTPGGGVDEGESLEDAATRECLEETGIKINIGSLKRIPLIDYASTEKTLETGERVWCKMQFNRFEVKLGRMANEIKAIPSDDLVELKWFTLHNLASLKLIPGAKEFFINAGYIPKVS